MSHVRAMSPDDLNWFQGLLDGRAQARVAMAPWFWMPAPDAQEKQRAWRLHLIKDPEVTALRTDHAGAIASPTWSGADVDDFAVDDPTRYTDDGAELLEALRGAGKPIRLVVPFHERERLALAESLDWLDLEQVWWTRSLREVQTFTAPPDDPVSTPKETDIDGTTVFMVMAPPVYQQDRPVLGIREVTRRGAVEEAERWAAANGAGNSTLIAAPGDDWTREKYLRTTGFFAEQR